MKTMKAALAILSLAGNMGFTTASAAGVPGVISKDALAARRLLSHEIRGDLERRHWVRLIRFLKKRTRVTSSTSMGRATTIRWAGRKFKHSSSNCSIVELANMRIDRS